MTTLAERLTVALARIPGAKQADLARACKVKSASVSNWFTGETKSLKADTLQRAATFLRVRPLWLMKGDGPMEDTPTDWPFAHLVDVTYVRRLSAAGQSEIAGYIKALIARELGRDALLAMETGPGYTTPATPSSSERSNARPAESGKRAVGGNT